MLYLETIEDANGDVVEYRTYCQFDAPDPLDAWPVWDMAADCFECGVHLRDGDGDSEGTHVEHN